MDEASMVSGSQAWQSNAFIHFSLFLLDFCWHIEQKSIIVYRGIQNFQDFCLKSIYMHITVSMPILS